MKINIHNYEGFFLDYIEGNLPASGVEELKSFLVLHPELQEELDEFENVRLVPENELFAAKNTLRKSVQKPTNEQFIARMEGDMTETEEREFDRILDVSPVYQNEYQQFKATKLIPDLAIHFGHKNDLRQKESKYKVLVLRAIYSSVAIAAGFTILLGTYFYFEKSQQNLLPKTGHKQISIAQNSIAVNNYISTNKIELPKVKNKVKEVQANQTLATIAGDSAKTVQKRDFEAIASLRPVNQFIISKAQNDILSLKKIKQTEPEPVYLAEAKVEEIPTIGEYLQYNVKRQFLPQESVEKRKVKFWDVARKFANVVNKMTGSEMDIKPDYSNEGKLLSLDINAKKFSYSKKF
jgi:hypothetical protein